MPHMVIPVEFWMRAISVEDGSLVSWTVAGEPDYGVKQAPVPVDPLTAHVGSSTRWPVVYCTDCESRITTPDYHEENPGVCDMEKVRRVMRS